MHIAIYIYFGWVTPNININVQKGHKVCREAEGIDVEIG